MTKEEVMEYLKEKGNAQTKNIYLNHGAKEPLYGVKSGDLRELAKKIKTDHELAIELYKTGNSDAMYFAGFIEDPKKVTLQQMDEWVEAAYWNMISESCVATVAAKTPFAFELAKKWVDSDDEQTVCAGYAIYNYQLSRLDDSLIDMDEIKALLDRVEDRIHSEGVEIQNAMNNFLVLTGIYVKPLHEYAVKIAEKVGKIKPRIAENNCNVQTASEYLEKYAKLGKIGIKIGKRGC